jgi:hypothetical protein
MRRDTGIGLGLLAFCGVLYQQAGVIPVPPFVPLGPAFYPRLLLLLLAGLAVWLVVDSLVASGAAAAAGYRPNYRLVAACFAILGVYIGGISVIGYFPATFLFVLGLSWCMSPRQVRELPRLLAVAAGATVGVYIVFERYLRVFLPRGWLF